MLWQESTVRVVEEIPIEKVFREITVSFENYRSDCNVFFDVVRDNSRQVWWCACGFIDFYTSYNTRVKVILWVSRKK